MKHDLIKTGDPDVFAAILDRNGEVVLDYCRCCKRGEAELEASCWGPPKGKCPICGCHVYEGDHYDQENHDKLAHQVNAEYTGGV